MTEQVEITSIDLRFEAYRLKNKAAERALLASIAEKGIRDPLQGADTEEGRILLNGFKRYRCAKKLGIGIVPYRTLAVDTPLGIIELIRISNAKSLNILEQAKLIDELKTVYRMGTGDIANLLEKSKAWVSVRTGIMNEMSPTVMKHIFTGQFPAYAFMYILRPFIRVNKIDGSQIDEFVSLTAGRGLSIRDLEMLAHSYFKGPDEIRKQMKEGNLSWVLKSFNQPSSPDNGCTQKENQMLRELEIVQKYMRRVIWKSRDDRYKTDAFLAQANLLTGGVLKLLTTFGQAMRDFHDRTRQT